MNKIKTISLALMMMTTIASMAQMRLSFGDESQLRKLQIAEMAIKSLYVDSVDEKKLVEDGIRGMLEKLDPHSSYSTPKEVKAMNEPLAGNFEGIGVQFNMIDDTLLVIQPVTGGPSSCCETADLPQLILSAKKMAEAFSEMKDIHVAEKSVTIKSALNDESLCAIKELAEEIVKA